MTNDHYGRLEHVGAERRILRPPDRIPQPQIGAVVIGAAVAHEIRRRDLPVEHLRQRRTELGRLCARRDAAGAQAPAWLASYIAELEAEVQRLES